MKKISAVLTEKFDETNYIKGFEHFLPSNNKKQCFLWIKDLELNLVLLLTLIAVDLRDVI